MAAQSQEVALPGSTSGLAPPDASEPVWSLLASVGNESLLLCKACITWECWDRPGLALLLRGCRGGGQDGSYLLWQLERFSWGSWRCLEGAEGSGDCDHHESPVGLTQHPLA